MSSNFIMRFKSGAVKVPVAVLCDTRLVANPRADQNTVLETPAGKKKTKITRDANGRQHFFTLSAADRLLYLVLLGFDFYGKNECYPSETLLSELTGLSLRKVKNAIAKLTLFGYIRVQHGSENEAGQRRKSNLYTLRVK